MDFPGIISIKDNCTGCGACVEVCKKKCISLKEDEHGFYYPHIELSMCISCNACSKSCHVLANSNQYSSPVWWNKSKLIAYQSYDKAVLEKSTSGGAFSALASKVIEGGGVVFASRYNGSKERLEFASTDQYDLDTFRKSRYMESNTNRVFPTIKEFLRSGRLVLFCGTPCQVAGLNCFLGNTQKDNLITINFVCHGVPSNKNFHQWLHKKFPHVGIVENIDFRYKNKTEGWGWHEMCLCIHEKDGEKIKLPYTQSSYYLSFCNNDFLRKSCYNCHIVNNSYADITIADYWGVNKKKDIVDNNTGISLIILHSSKAQVFLTYLHKNGLIHPLNYQDVEYAFHSRHYSIANRKKNEADINRYGYIGFLNKKYRKIIIKYRIMNYFHFQKIIKWLRR